MYQKCWFVRHPLTSGNLPSAWTAPDKKLHGEGQAAVGTGREALPAAAAAVRTKGAAAKPLDCGRTFFPTRGPGYKGSRTPSQNANPTAEPYR